MLCWRTPRNPSNGFNETLVSLHRGTCRAPWRLSGAPGRLWRLLARPWRPPGASLVPPGRSPAASWRPRAPPWRPLALPGTWLWRLLGSPGTFPVPLAASCASRLLPGASLTLFGSPLARAWRPPGASGRLLAFPGPLWRSLSRPGTSPLNRTQIDDFRAGRPPG